MNHCVKPSFILVFVISILLTNLKKKLMPSFSGPGITLDVLLHFAFKLSLLLALSKLAQKWCYIAQTSVIPFPSDWLFLPVQLPLWPLLFIWLL